MITVATKWSVFKISTKVFDTVNSSLHLQEEWAVATFVREETTAGVADDTPGAIGLVLDEAGAEAALVAAVLDVGSGRGVAE